MATIEDSDGGGGGPGQQDQGSPPGDGAKALTRVECGLSGKRYRMPGGVGQLKKLIYCDF